MEQSVDAIVCSTASDLPAQLRWRPSAHSSWRTCTSSITSTWIHSQKRCVLVSSACHGVCAFTLTFCVVALPVSQFNMSFYLQYMATWPSLFYVAESVDGKLMGYSECLHCFSVVPLKPLDRSMVACLLCSILRTLPCPSFRTHTYLQGVCVIEFNITLFSLLLTPLFVRFPSCLYYSRCAFLASLSVLAKVEGEGERWHGHVTAITVAPEYRRLGVARQLMEILEEVSERWASSIHIILSALFHIVSLRSFAHHAC